MLRAICELQLIAVTERRYNARVRALFRAVCAARGIAAPCLFAAEHSVVHHLCSIAHKRHPCPQRSQQPCAVQRSTPRSTPQAAAPTRAEHRARQLNHPPRAQSRAARNAGLSEFGRGCISDSGSGFQREARLFFSDLASLAGGALVSVAGGLAAPAVDALEDMALDPQLWPCSAAVCSPPPGGRQAVDDIVRPVVSSVARQGRRCVPCQEPARARFVAEVCPLLSWSRSRAAP